MYLKMFEREGFQIHDDFVEAEEAIIIFHGHFLRGKYQEFNDRIKRYKWVLALRTGDEENRFDINKVDHPNIKWWIQYPVKNSDYGDARLIPIGVPDYFTLPDTLPKKDIDIFMSAQNTHIRRNLAFSVAEKIAGNNYINKTNGFSAGLERKEYRDLAFRSKIMPAPSGAISPDSFRLYEALEAGALPIADDISPRIDSSGFFERLFLDPPFPIVTDWSQLEIIIKNHTPKKQQEINQWWTNYKKSLIINLWDDINELCKK